MSVETLNTHKPLAAGHAEIRRVDLSEPLDWLVSGIATFRAAPGASLLYGALFSLACLAVLALARELPGFTIAFLTGLLLVGPFLAAGLYAAARQHERGMPVSISAGLGLLLQRRTQLGLFAVVLAIVMAAWVRISALLFAVKFSAISPSIEGYLGLLRGEGDPWVAAYFAGIGFLLALTVFVISAVAIPMIVDRDAGPVAAMGTSVRVVARNIPAMTIWAAFIVALTGIGILTFFAAMVVLFPVLGYATWHSYRGLVERE